MASTTLYRGLKIIDLEKSSWETYEEQESFVVTLPSDIYALLNYNYTHANITHHLKSPYYLAVLISQKLNLLPQSKHKH